MTAGSVIEEVFTTDERATPIHVTSWGVLGDSWPFFRPNFRAAEDMRAQHCADEVRVHPANQTRSARGVTGARCCTSGRFQGTAGPSSNSTSAQPRRRVHSTALARCV